MPTKRPATRRAPAKRPGTELARPAPREIAEADLQVEGPYPSSKEIATAVRSGVKLFIESEGAGGSILADSLEAVSVESLFATGELVKMKDHLDEDVRVTRIVGANPSDFSEEGGLGVYLVVEAVLDTGEVVNMALGAANPMGVVVRLAELDALPRTVRFEKAKKATRGGFYPINTVDAEPF